MVCVLLPDREAVDETLVVADVLCVVEPDADWVLDAVVENVDVPVLVPESDTELVAELGAIGANPPEWW